MSQASSQWDTFAMEFYRDGSLRDIYVFETDLEDWRKMATFVGRNYQFTFCGEWREATFPPEIAVLFPRNDESALTMLAIDVTGVRVNCHFFDAREIELDLDPADVRDPSALNGIFTFMKGLARSVEKDVLLTPENMREIAIFRCRPREDLIEHAPFGGFSLPAPR